MLYDAYLDVVLVLHASILIRRLRELNGIVLQGRLNQCTTDSFPPSALLLNTTVDIDIGRYIVYIYIRRYELPVFCYLSCTAQQSVLWSAADM